MGDGQVKPVSLAVVGRMWREKAMERVRVRSGGYMFGCWSPRRRKLGK